MHHYNGPGDMRHGMMSYGMMSYSWIWIIGLILLAVIVFVGIFLIFRQSQQSIRQNDNKKDRSLIILKERFAKGELTEEEYKAKRDILEKD